MAATKLLPEWVPATSFEDGWLAGMFDGEGCLSFSQSRDADGKVQGGGMRLSIAQNTGAALGQVHGQLARGGYATNTYYRDSGLGVVDIAGRPGEKARLLGSLRPQRLLGKFVPEMMGRTGRGDADEIVSIRDGGIGRIVQMETSTGTFISEGYAHHNCHYFTRTAKGWAGKNPHPNAQTMTRREMVSCVAGHTPGLDTYIHPAGGGAGLIRGTIAGSFYQHDEAYQGPQGNRYWRGCLMLHEVADGYYNAMEVSMNYLLSNYGD
jgi:hypothetical protein